ncbi:MAG: hypothetical protein J6Y48_20015 [Clostridia bacterium]|nr:hypothetical protein [Clostridia bacterium]
MADRKKIRKILIRILEIVFSAALLVLLAVSLILAKPQEDKTVTPAASPAVQASQAIRIDQENDLVHLDFPAPLMCFQNISGMTFTEATCADITVPGGYGRVAVTTWQTEEGDEIVLKSVFPADALNVLEEGFHFMPYAGPTFFGNTSVRMENDQFIRLHTTTDQALYEVLLPRRLSKKLTQICGFLKLYNIRSDS